MNELDQKAGREDEMEETAQKADFEQNLRQLEDIVARLERGNLPLEQSMKLYERGIELYKNCRGLLQNAESRVVKLMAGIEGELEEEPLDLPEEEERQ